MSVRDAGGAPGASVPRVGTGAGAARGRRRGTRSARGRQAAATPARRVAYDVLTAVEESDAYANLLLPSRLDRAGLHGAEAGLATALCYGTLRLQGYYDRVLAEAGGREPASLDAAVRRVLRLGVHQILGMRVPDHAAVHESVDLAREVGAGRASGLVNAILRRVTAHPETWWRAAVLKGVTGEDDRLAIEFSHPLWVVQALRRALKASGAAPGELPELLAADNLSPAVNLAILRGGAADASWPPDRFSPVGRTLPAGDPRQIVAAGAGRIRVQDEGSQLVALALARARPAVAGERWLDMCAGPGGKAALLASEAEAQGARLIANEIVPGRARRVREALAAWQETTQVVVGDARRLPQGRPGAFDRILLDAPCSGLGALRRRPEARWRKDPADIAALAGLQSSLLRAALDCAAPGGLIAYATCSPHVEETREVVAGVLAERGDVRLLPAGRILAGLARDTPPVSPEETMVQLWPHRHGTDGMFLALLERRAPDLG